jgi:hypothetical protein
MYIQWKSAIHVLLLFKGTQTVEKALLDSGATENFLDRRTVARLKLPIKQLKDPRWVYNVDGSNNKAGQIMHECQLKLNYGAKELEQRFFVSDLGVDQALLGYPFLREFNPKIDWTKGQLQEAKGVIVQNTHMNTMRWSAAKEVLHIQRDAIKQMGKPKKGEAIYMQRTTFATQWAAKNEKANNEPEIPDEYKRHAIIFSEQAAKRFPPSREENMAIKFISGAPTNIDCKVYPLNRDETNWLITQIGKELDMGYIKPESSPITSPTFLVPKKQPGQYQMVVDYRKVNDITEKDHYTMANAETELDKLKGKKVFTKFDIRAGYNNILIEGD